MCNKTVLESCGTLESVPECYKNDNNPHALEFIFDCYKTQEMCDKAINNYPSTIKFVHE